MTVHVLHAGDGYTYLTRQVASHDVPRERGQSLSSYYVHDGNPPGVWVGEGLCSLDVQGQVTEAQMKALFGEGRHPDADKIERELIAQGASAQEALEATKLGRRFPQFKKVEDDGFEAHLEQQHAHFFDEHGRVPTPGRERDDLRRTAARLTLTGLGRPSEPAHIARYLATERGAQRQPVAGYDLVFTPVKSVSVLWGLGDEHVQREVGAAHQSAWTSVLAWLETEAALTRVGAGGVAQVDTKGLVATAFDHIDSRSGDPNLHTHLAVANKVQGLDGKWRALDGRVLHALGVAASERYNTLIEVELTRRLGVQFAEEPTTGRKRPVREIVGIPASLRDEFSSRRASIETEFASLIATYRSEHGHEPSKATQIKLAQQATLSTRQEKDEGVALSTRRAQWHARAQSTLGSPEAVATVIEQATIVNTREPALAPATSLEDLRKQVMEGLVQDRAVWTIGHIQAQAQRVARTQVGVINPDRIQPLAAQLVEAALASSLPLSPPEVNPAPEALRRADGKSVYRQHSTDRFTSIEILDAEQRIVTAGRTRSGFVVDQDVFTRTLERESERSGMALNTAQTELARRFATGGHLVEAGIGPAGAGKTSAMSQFAAAVHAAGGNVLALAPSAAAAAVLSDELEVPAETISKLLDAHQRSLAGDSAALPPSLRIDARTIILVDEAGMASTPDLDAVVALARTNGAGVRLLGDPAQLQAVGAGGALRLVDQLVGAVHLEQVHRFSVDGEATASLELREGNEGALDFYIDRHRTIGGTREAMIEEVYANWLADSKAGKKSLMVAASSHAVLALSTQARLDRVAAGDVERDGALLHDESVAGVGDLVVTRRNDRRLVTGRGTDFVKNGDVWTVIARPDDGSLRVRHRDHRTVVTLPSDYVSENVELAYATTIHRSQGMTVDTTHLLLSAGATREQLYTGVTRGRHDNRIYVAVDELLDPDLHVQPTGTQAVRACLETVLKRTDPEPTATATINAEHERAVSLSTLVPQYEDVWERLLSAGADERLAGIVRVALPEEAAGNILEDEAWPALGARMLLHERHGAHLSALLSDAFTRREVESASSIAQVMLHRLGEPPGAPGGRLPGRITPLSALLAASAGPPPTPALDQSDPANSVRVEDRATPAIGEEAAPVDHEAARVMEVNEAAWKFWRESAGDPESWVPDYLASRNLAALGAGHAPPGWTATINALRAQGFTDEDLSAAGIATVSRRGQLIDRFRDRLVVPVRDTLDRIRAFTARSNPAESNDRAPKYINSPETAAYRKSEQLFGLDERAAKHLREGARTVLVEGALDCAAVRAADPEAIPVAPCGTAVTTDQLELIRSLSPQGLAGLTVALDGDSAGLQAAARLWAMLPAHEAAAVRAVKMPTGTDPADLVATGCSQDLRDLLASPGSLTELVVDHLLDGYDLNQVERRVQTVRDIAELVAAMPAAEVAATAGQVQARMGTQAPQMLIDMFMTAHLDAVETRVAEHIESTTTPRQPQNTDTGSHTRPEIDPELASWLEVHTELIATRLDALVAQVEYAPPAWASTSITPVPTDPAQAQQWREDVRAIVAYRDRWDITSTTPVLTEQCQGTQQRAQDEAAEALNRVQATQHTATSLRDEALERARLRSQTQQRTAAARDRMLATDKPTTFAERAAALRKARESSVASDRTTAERLSALQEQQRHVEPCADDVPAHQQKGPQR